MFVVIMPLCNRMFCCIFGWYFYIEIRLKYEKNILLSSSRAFSLSTSVENSEATWKKATKCNKLIFFSTWNKHYYWGPEEPLFMNVGNMVWLQEIVMGNGDLQFQMPLVYLKSSKQMYSKLLMMWIWIHFLR